MIQSRQIVTLGGASALVLAIAACSEAEAPGSTGADMATEAVSADAVVAERAAGSAIPPLADIPANLPQLAYIYDYRWELAPDAIGPLQRRHANLCEQQGPASCQIIGMTRTGDESDDVRGELQMAVATRQARAFGALLEDEAEDAGATQIAADIQSEEVSRQIVDTEARLRARTELRDRLIGVLRTRKGTVAELVEAERSVAAVNEEIDQARSWLNETRGRVAYSRMTVYYQSAAPGGEFLRPVQGALGSLGAIFGYLSALAILLGAVALPVGGVWWASRTLRRRWTAAAQPSAALPGAD